METQNLSNNQGLRDLFSSLMTKNTSFKEDIKGSDFSSFIEKFSQNMAKNDTKKNNVVETKDITNKEILDTKCSKTSKDSNNIKTKESKGTNQQINNDDKKIKLSKENNNNVEKKNEVKKIDNESSNDANKIKISKNECKTHETQNDEELQEIQDESISDKIETNIDEILDTTFTLSNELVSEVMSALKDTQKFSDEELTKIKEVFEENLGSKINLKDFLENLENVLKDTNLFSVQSVDEFIKDVSQEIEDFFYENKISLDENFVKVEESQSININLEVNKNVDNTDINETTQETDLQTTFEKILNEIFKANIVSSENSESNDSLDLGYNFNNVLSNNKSTSENVNEIIVSSFKELINESNIENSSIMNLEQNFNETQDFIKTLNVETKNVSINNLKSDVRLSALESTTSLRVLERVEEVLKSISQSKDGSTISLRLDPPSLGEVKIDMTYKNGTLFARIIASSEDVENLLKSKSNELWQVLRESGVDADNINVLIASRDSFANFENNDNSKKDFSNNNLKVVDNTKENDESTQLDNEEIIEIKDSKWIA